MVVLKRKTNDVKKYDGLDNIIEIEDTKPQFSSRKIDSETNIYSPREAFIKPKQREEVMPRIKNEIKPIPKDSVSAKTKILLAAYIVIAIILAGVVIATGMAITEVGNRNTELENRILNLDAQITEQINLLERYSDNTYMRGKASELNMENINDYKSIPLVNTVESVQYSQTTNWFDKLCNFLNILFNN